MNGDIRVNYLGKINVDGWRDALSKKDSNIWEKYPIRWLSQSIPLFWWVFKRSVPHPYEEVVKVIKFYPDEFLDFIPLLEETLDVVSKHFKVHTPVKAFIAKMTSMSRIERHRDCNPYRRVHIPILTNPNVIFTVDEVDFHMETGGIYELDESKFHSVVNNGAEDRHHLIIDYLPDCHALIGYEIEIIRDEDLPMGCMHENGSLLTVFERCVESNGWPQVKKLVSQRKNELLKLFDNLPREKGDANRQILLKFDLE